MYVHLYTHKYYCKVFHVKHFIQFLAAGVPSRQRGLMRNMTTPCLGT
jgi:hypothetical protein